MPFESLIIPAASYIVTLAVQAVTNKLVTEVNKKVNDVYEHYAPSIINSAVEVVKDAELNEDEYIFVNKNDVPLVPFDQFLFIGEKGETELLNTGNFLIGTLSNCSHNNLNLDYITAAN